MPNWFYNRAMRHLIVSLFALLFASAALACNFEYSPAAATLYYREAGWQLPGTKDFNPRATPRSYGTPFGKVPEARRVLLAHDEDPYIVEFPSQAFTLNGVRQRLHSIQVMATVVRLEMNDHVVAYSYRMIPVKAHRNSGKWVVDDEALCIFYATFIDDKGDGVFRELSPGEFTPDLVPAWAKKPKN